MRVIAPYVVFPYEEELDQVRVLKKLEEAGRTCYKSEDKITAESAIKFIGQTILLSGHESVLEHEKVTVRIICDRGVSHEIVRHRIASYSQESTRYCNYSKDKFGNEITVIKPCFWEEDSEKYKNWHEACLEAEKMYFKLLKLGASPQEARSVLPHSLKTEIVATYNLREWRHFLKLRTSLKAHPQMREIAIPILEKFQEKLPVLFSDIKLNE